MPPGKQGTSVHTHGSLGPSACTLRCCASTTPAYPRRPCAHLNEFLKVKGVALGHAARGVVASTRSSVRRAPLRA